MKASGDAILVAILYAFGGAIFGIASVDACVTICSFDSVL